MSGRLSRISGLPYESSSLEVGVSPSGEQSEGQEVAALSSLSPQKGEVILLPAEDPEVDGSVHTHYAYRASYPQAGWVVALGKEVQEDIRLYDLALIEVESKDVASVRDKVLEVCFKDGTTALFDNDGEIEPIVREVVEEYRANPTSKDMRIRVLALDGEGYQFLASDVLTYQWRETASPEFGLLYPMNVKMFALWNGTAPQLYYVVHQSHILGVIR